MVCGPRRSATCNGSRSSSPRAASTFTGSRTESLTGSRREHGLDGLDGLLDLLVRHLLYAVRVLSLHLARHQKRKNFEVRGRLVTSDLLNCLLAVLAEMQQQRLHELLIEQVTRAVCLLPWGLPETPCWKVILRSMSAALFSTSAND